jgi:hypothetical protein
MALDAIKRNAVLLALAKKQITVEGLIQNLTLCPVGTMSSNKKVQSFQINLAQPIGTVNGATTVLRFTDAQIAMVAQWFGLDVNKAASPKDLVALVNINLRGKTNRLATFVIDPYNEGDLFIEGKGEGAKISKRTTNGMFVKTVVTNESTIFIAEDAKKDAESNTVKRTALQQSLDMATKFDEPEDPNAQQNGESDEEYAERMKATPKATNKSKKVGA